ncbi:MAG: DUF4382 domain-containing protein [Thermoprotei archaeon]
MLKALGIVGVIVVLAVIGYFAYGYFTTGQVNVYIHDPPGSGNQSPVKIYLTVASIMLHKENATGNPWVTVSNRTITVLLSSNATFLASSRIPAGVYNEVRLVVVSGAVQIGNINVSATLPSQVLKIPIVGGMKLSGGSSVNLVIELPGVHYANGRITISPSTQAYVQS